MKALIYLYAWRYFSLGKVFSSLIQSFGVFWLLIEIISYFLPSSSASVKEYWGICLVLGFGVGVILARPRLAISNCIQGTDSSIEIVISDMFRLDGPYIIGSNTTFDTSIEDGTISSSSTQGQFVERFSDSIEQLDRQIADALSETEHTVLSSEDKPFGKKLKYEVGTVAQVMCSGKKAYLVAISTFNKYKVALANKRDILDALSRLWSFISTRGGIEPLCCPILGSGFSRIHATREELIRDIIQSFIAAAREGKFCEKLTIVIAPSDFRKINIDMRALGNYLAHECTYSAMSPEPQPENGGTQLNSST